MTHDVVVAHAERQAEAEFARQLTRAGGVSPALCRAPGLDSPNLPPVDPRDVPVAPWAEQDVRDVLLQGCLPGADQ
jgi:hypothetical protein